MTDTPISPDLLRHDRWRRSNDYPPEWVAENQMGPHALWLLEALLEVMPLRPDERVLDLGCGRAMTSIMLARDLGAQVWANDLWIPAEDNRERLDAAGVADQATAVHAEAHALPYESGFFDAIVSIDAYQYFGTADLYIGQITEFLRPGGRIGIVVPSLTSELGAQPPASLAPFWEWDFCCFHTPDWWRHHWTKSGKVAVETAESIDGAWEDWLRFSLAIAPMLDGWMRDMNAQTCEMLEADRGRNLGLTRVVAVKPE